MIIVLIFVFQVVSTREHLRHRIKHTLDQMLIGPEQGGLFAEIARQQNHFHVKNDHNNNHKHHHKHHMDENCINAIHIIYKDQQDYKSLRIGHTDEEQITGLEIKQMINVDTSDLDDSSSMKDSDQSIKTTPATYNKKDNAKAFIGSDQSIENLAPTLNKDVTLNTDEDDQQLINYFKSHNTYETKQLYDEQPTIQDIQNHQELISQQKYVKSEQPLQQELVHPTAVSNSDSGNDSILSKLFRFEHVNTSPEHISSDLTKVEEVIKQLDDEPIKNQIHDRIIEKINQLPADPIQNIPIQQPKVQQQKTESQSITDQMSNLKPVQFGKETQFHTQQSQKKEEKQQRIAEVRKEIEDQLKEKLIRETHAREKSDYAYESSYLEWQVNTGQGPDYAIKL